MEVMQCLEGNRLTLKPIGRVDTLTSPQLAARVKTEGITELIFDFSECDYISSAGLRVLLQARKSMRDNKVIIAHACSVVREIFNVVGFADAFEFVV